MDELINPIVYMDVITYPCHNINTSLSKSLFAKAAT